MVKLLNYNVLFVFIDGIGKLVIFLINLNILKFMGICIKVGIFVGSILYFIVCFIVFILFFLFNMVY